MSSPVNCGGEVQGKMSSTKLLHFEVISAFRSECPSLYEIQSNINFIWIRLSLTLRMKIIEIMKEHSLVCLTVND